ncbi:hypothetical protein G6F65_020333 [Rhizopus arrhizus]|nr:hypothetical protein G6F65_020333 [Rhizopus arrhizus]
MRIEVGQGQPQLLVLGAEAVLLAEVAGNADQALDGPIAQQRALAGQAPARFAVGEQVQLHQVLDHLAGQHAGVLVDIVRAEPGRVDLGRGTPDHILARAQSQPPQHGLVDVGVTPLAVLDEEQHVRNGVEQGFDVGGLDSHAASIAEAALPVRSPLRDLRLTPPGPPWGPAPTGEPAMPRAKARPSASPGPR